MTRQSRGRFLSDYGRQVLQDWGLVVVAVVLVVVGVGGLK